MATGGAAFDDQFIRKLEALALLARRLPGGDALGGRRARRRVGAGLDIADHRDYVPGDDLRRLDWSVLGRLERPLVRLYEQDDDVPVILLVDTSASMGLGEPDKFTLAQRAAAALAYVGLSNLDRVAVHAVGDGLGPGVGPLRGRAQIHPVLSFLSGLTPQGRTHLAPALATLLDRQSGRALVIVLSDFYDEDGVDRLLARVDPRRCEAVFVQIAAPEERSPSFQGDVTLVDRESGAERRLSLTPAALAAYRERYTRWLQTLERRCRERGARWLSVSSAMPFEEVVLDVFRVGGLVG